MIQLNCHNCENLITAANIISIDTITSQAHCGQCGEIYLISIVVLRKGSKIDRPNYWVTYDANNNKIPYVSQRSEQPTGCPFVNQSGVRCGQPAGHLQNGHGNGLLTTSHDTWSLLQEIKK